MGGLLNWHALALALPWRSAPGASYVPAMAILESIYRVGATVAAAGLPLLERGEGKLARGIRGQRAAVGEMARWAAAERDPARPLVWVHAPSVGEGHQARAVIAALRERRPEVQIAYTFFSPSALPFSRSVLADWTGYLPPDTGREMAGALDALRPDVVAFTKTEIWPNLTREAAARGIPTVLLSATLPERAGRLSLVGRTLLRPAHRRLARVGAISAGDGERFGLLGVPEARRTVMGDARFDQVSARAEAVDREAGVVERLRGAGDPVLVAGSTWPEDEARLIPAVAALRKRGTACRLVLVPHEPTDDHLDGAAARLSVHEVPHARLSEVEGEDGSLPDCILVDRVGVLGDLYAAATVAYVGGGFGEAGLHSVLEPAAFGAPVLFGPRHENAREAAEMIAAGGALQVDSKLSLGELLERWTGDEELRAAAGEQARRYVEAGRGAAERGADILEALLAARGAEKGKRM